MRVIPTRVHGVLDYLMGLLVAASPWIFGFNDNGAETWVPVVLGLGVIAYSLITAYELGVAKIIAMPFHLALDGAGGAVLAASPWIFGFNDDVWAPHLILGLLEIGAALMTRTRPEYNVNTTERTDPGERSYA